jgi:microcystin degradation protein MlrC
MRAGIIAILQESNTFLPERTGIEHFESDLLVCGAEVRERLEGSHHEAGGFFEGLSQAGIEPVGLFAARALPHGILQRAAAEQLLRRLFRELDRAGPLDGYLVAAHGATAAEGWLDFDGHWLSLLRARLGPRAPIAGTLDPHANLSRRMVEAADALVAYRTNPHLDQRERGLEAAAILARRLRGEARPVQAACFPPLAISIERQGTDEPPLADLLALAAEVRARPGMLAASVLFGFPYADVPEMGSSALAVADGDARLAARAAAELARGMWERRAELRGEPLSVDAALDEAERAEGRVCLLDMGDNVGGGAPGSATWLARAIAERGIESAAAVLYDPAAAAAAGAAGVGRTVKLQVGGRREGGDLDECLGPPLEDRFTVLALHDGRFREELPRHGGFGDFDQGACAALRSSRGLTLLVTSKRMPPFSLRQLTSAGLEPRSFRLLVAKGVHAPVAAYREVCDRFIRAGTPGYTAADPRVLHFVHRRRPLYPFETDFEWHP